MKRKWWWVVLGLAALAIGGTMTTVQINNIVNTLPKGKGAYKRRTLSSITGIVVHHSAADSGTPTAIANYHISRGWPGIGYHFVISPDGAVSQTNDLESISYHVGYYNTTYVGICLIGHLSKHPPTPQQMDSLRGLIKHVKSTIGKDLVVKGHRDLAATECPGKMMDLKKI